MSPQGCDSFLGSLIFESISAKSESNFVPIRYKTSILRNSLLLLILDVVGGDNSQNSVSFLFISLYYSELSFCFSPIPYPDRR